jgi:YesN/AraC family two-component response regulator
VFAFSGEEALHYLSNRPLDLALVLSDINMPGMDGIELLKRIKTQSPALSIFMITAYEGKDFVQNAMDNGADGYLTKPIDFESLKKRILEFGSVR